MKVVSSKQMKCIEQEAINSGISQDVLMENAGLSIAKTVCSRLNSSHKKSVLSLVGPGNNGGDGLVASRILHKWHIPVVIYLATNSTNCNEKYQQCIDSNIHVINASSDFGQKILHQEILNAGIILDAIFGAGSSQRIDDGLYAILTRINAAKQKSPKAFQILSIDMPSGIDPDDGSIASAALSADVTLALGAPKLGLFRLPGATNIGKLEKLQIGIPEHLFDNVPIRLIDKSIVQKHLPARPLHSSKHSFGKILIIAGSPEYMGAARLATLAAYRTGSGLVTLATPRSVYKLLAPTLPEATYQPLPESKSGRINKESIPLIQSIIHRYDAVLIGCGLGFDKSTTGFIKGLICNTNMTLPPTVLDADGLNCIATIPTWWKHVNNPMVLTPHHREMMRLTRENDNFDPLDIASKYSQAWNQTVALKGSISIIAGPKGYCTINAHPNPCLSTAGTGDILAGIITSFLGQQLDPEIAALIGVYIHSKAAEEISNTLGDRGMLAGDLIDQIPKAITAIRGDIGQDIV
mgnify:CR=1 FL=1